MSVRKINTCGQDYDTSTLSTEFIQFTSDTTVSADGTYGFVLFAGTEPFGSRCYWALDGAPLASGIINVTAKFTPTTPVLIALEGVGGDATPCLTIGMNTDGSLASCGQNSPPVPSPGSWHTYEFKFLLSTAGTGTLEVRLDGNPLPFWSITGVTTGTSAAGTMLRLHNAFFAIIMVQDLVSEYMGDPTDNFLGEVKPFVLFPTADVGSPQWTNDFGGPNFAQVDARIPSGDTHFLHSETPGDTDEYTIGALPGDVVQVIGLAVKINAKKFAGGTRILGAVLDNGTTQHIGADLAIASGQYSEYNEYFGTNPLTGSPWALADFTGGGALRIGMTVKS